jgi:UDP-N-acetylglucosamine transferase subunit ALG13
MVAELDAFAAAHPDEDVVIQAGPAAETVRHARGVSFLPEPQIRALARDARIVVTHGGPSLLLGLVDEGRVVLQVELYSCLTTCPLFYEIFLINFPV